MQPKRYGTFLLGNPFSKTSLGDIDRAIPLEGSPALCLVQTLPPQLGQDKDVKGLLQRNAKLWSSVKDLHTLNLLGSGEAEGTFFLSYEYGQGRLLSDILARCQQEGLPLSPDQAVYLAERIAGALISVSDPKMAFGCLSPERVLVTFEGEVKLLPGVFRDLHSTTASVLPALSHYRRYMPPGLVATKATKPAADRYALGALMFEFLCRESFRPGDDAFDPAVRLGEIQAGFTGIDPLPEALHAILLKSCVPDAPEAYAELSNMKADLDQLVTSGEYSPTTFNIAFLMHTLFRGEDEEDSAADQAFTSLDREKFRPAPPPPAPPRPAPPVHEAPRPVPVPVPAPPAGDSPTFGIEPEASKKGLFIGIGVAAVLAIMAILGYLAFFRDKAPSKEETTAQEQLAKLQKEQLAMAAKLKSLEDEKAQLSSEVANAKTADEKAKAQKALDEAQRKLLAQREEQKRLADAAAGGPSAPPPKPSAPAPVQPPAQASSTAPPPSSPPPAQPDAASAPPSPPSPQPPPAEPPSGPAAAEKVKAGDFVELWSVDVKPKQMNELRVDMPAAARQNHISGTIYVEVNIDETGKVTASKVVRGLSSDFGMNRACEEATLRLKYSPAFKEGVPVKTKYTFPIQVK